MQITQYGATVLGMTGTREGMTGAQRRRFAVILGEATVLHHGDCVGADADAHDLARAHGCYIVVHPPADDRLRAYCAGDEVRTAKPYFARNRDIVDECDLLVATPKETKVHQRGGTWYTVGYAMSVGRRHVVIWPDGSITDGTT